MFFPKDCDNPLSNSFALFFALNENKKKKTFLKHHDFHDEDPDDSSDPSDSDSSRPYKDYK